MIPSESVCLFMLPVVSNTPFRMGQVGFSLYAHLYRIFL